MAKNWEPGGSSLVGMRDPSFKGSHRKEAHSLVSIPRHTLRVLVPSSPIGEAKDGLNLENISDGTVNCKHPLQTLFLMTGFPGLHNILSRADFICVQHEHLPASVHPIMDTPASQLVCPLDSFPPASCFPQLFSNVTLVRHNNDLALPLESRPCLVPVLFHQATSSGVVRRGLPPLLPSQSLQPKHIVCLLLTFFHFSAHPCLNLSLASLSWRHVSILLVCVQRPFLL